MTAPTDRAGPPLAKPGGGKAAPRGGAAGTTSNAADEDEWRHEPVAPVDEGNPLKSLGKAVGDTVTGAETPTPPATRSR